MGHIQTKLNFVDWNAKNKKKVSIKAVWNKNEKEIFGCQSVS